MGRKATLTQDTLKERQFCRIAFRPGFLLNFAGSLLRLCWVKTVQSGASIWVHSNGDIVYGGVACVCVRARKMVHFEFCAYFCAKPNSFREFSLHFCIFPLFAKTLWVLLPTHQGGFGSFENCGVGVEQLSVQIEGLW